MDRLFWVVVRIKGGSRSREKNQTRGSSPVLSIPAENKHDGFSDRPLLFAAETTGGPGGTDPHQGFFSLPPFISSGISLRHHEDAPSPETRQGR